MSFPVVAPRLADVVADSPVNRLILGALREHGAMPRSQIARVVDLSKSTVDEHVRLLLRRGVLVEQVPTLSGRRGRPASLVQLPSAGGVTLGLVLRHGEAMASGPVECAVVSSAGNILAHRQVPGDDDPVAQGISALDTLLDDLGLDADALRCAVVGVPLPLDLSHVDDGAAVSEHAQVISSMHDVLGARPQTRVAAAFGVTSMLGNDADLAALGEAFCGGGRGKADVAFLKCLEGGGVGLVRGGRVQTGGRVTAGETEHVQVDGGMPCVCGAPSCSGDGRPVPLWVRVRRWGGRAESMAALQALTVAEDPQTMAALRRLGEELGRGLAGLHLVFQPSLIVLEAALGPAFVPLAAGLAEAVGLSAPPWARVPARVVLSTASPSPEIRGAAAAGVAQRAGA